MTIGSLFTAEYTGKIEKDLLKKAFYDIVFLLSSIRKTSPKS